MDSASDFNVLAKMQVFRDRVETYEFELIHTFSGVPMDESLSPVHGRELVSNTFEEGLDAVRVSLDSRTI